MTDIATAILAINPSAQVTVNAEDFEQITWLDGTAEISTADIDAKKAEFAYVEPRERAYPSWENQLDMLYHDKVNGTSTWQDAIQAVKDANPK